MNAWVEAFVLAGGKSSRMGSDKGLKHLIGKPMVSYVLNALEGTDIPLNIIANDNAYRSFGFPLFGDVVKEKGPMGGLLTAFANSEAEVVFLVSCDMPLISSEAIKELLKLADREKIIAATVEERVNPLFALYPVILKADVEKRIFSGRLKMTDFILENKHTLVPSIARDFPGIFRNVNNEEELKMTEKEWNNLK